MPARRLVDALNQRMRSVSSGSNTLGVKGADTFVATWRAAEALDPSLSMLQLPGGQPGRGVPKLSTVTGLVAGDPVVVLKQPNGTLLIVGKPEGNAGLASSSWASTDGAPPTQPGTPSISAPTLNSLTVNWSGSTDTGGAGLFGYDLYSADDGTYIATTTNTFYTVTGLRVNTTYQFKVRARDNAGNISTFSAVGSGTTANFPAPNPSDPVLYTVQWAPIWSGTYGYKGGTEFDDWYGGQCNQGRGNGGNAASLIGFDSAAIVAYASGWSVAGSAWLTLTYGSWYNPTGTAVIGTSTASERPLNYSGTPNRWRAERWNRGERRQVILDGAVCAEFLSGTTKAILLGPGPTTDVLYTGWAYGAGVGANQPILTLQFWR